MVQYRCVDRDETNISGKYECNMQRRSGTMWDIIYNYDLSCSIQKLILRSSAEMKSD